MKRFLIGFLVLVFTSILFAGTLENFATLSELSDNIPEVKEKVEKFIPFFQGYYKANNRNGYLLSESVREVNYDDTWHTSKESYEYNELNQMTDLYRHVRPETEWLYDDHIAFSYVEGTDLISESIRTDYVDGEWEYDEKIVFEYDDNDLLLSFNFYNAYDYEDIWGFDWKIDYVYENGNCVEETNSYFSFMDDDFIPSYKIYRDYNESNQLIQEISVTIEDGVQTNNFKEIFSYNDELLSESINFSWDGTNWINNCQNIRNYNDADFIINSSYYYWSEEGWQNPYIKEYTYDEYTLIQKKYYSEHDYLVINHSLFDYEYDEDENLIFQNEDQWEEDQWVPFDNYTNAYIPANTHAEDVIAPEFVLSNFPNPFNPITTILFAAISNSQNANLIIYNAKGQQIKNFENLNNQNSVVWKGMDNDGNPVGSGIYFYQLNVDNEPKAIRKCLLLK